MELGWVVGQGKPGFVLVEEEPERWDIMAQLATGVVTSIEELHELLDEVLVVKPALAQSTDDGRDK